MYEKNNYTVECFNLSSNYITAFEKYLLPNDNSTQTFEFNFVDNYHDCKMSASAIKTIKKATQMICYLSRKEYFKKIREKKQSGCTTKRFSEISYEAAKEANTQHLCTFLTLTLPAEQNHTDNEICKYLVNPLMSYARKYWRVKYYIWKKELQANGNLHFHLIFDRTVPWQSLRKEWNKLLNRGYVPGVKNKFNYIDRYHDKWAKIYANGFDRKIIREYVANQPSTQDAIKEQIEAWNLFNNNAPLSDAEYKYRKDVVIDKFVNRYYKAYKQELELPEAQRWRNPNSTDICGVRSAREVSAYLSKYISKDIENNPALADYQFYVDAIKKEIDEWQKAIIYKRNHGEDYSDAVEAWQKNLQALREYREQNSPIQGRMWFKSKSLTAFLNDASDYLQDEYYSELTDLETYLHTEENKINKRRAEKAAKAKAIGDTATYDKYKDPISLVLKRYKQNADGTTDFTKVICKTLCISIFDLQHMKTASGKPRFPYLSLAWNRHINKCIAENIKKGYYKHD